MKKWRMVLSCVLLVVLLSLLGCAGKKEESRYLNVAENNQGKNVLKLAGVCFADHPELQEAVTEFNAVQDKVRIELHDYMDGVEDFNDAVSRMNLDIMRGNMPDLIMVSSPIDSSIYAGKGLLCDLYGLMKDDGDFSKEMVVSSVLNSYEENGKLYSLMPGFAIKSAWGKASELGSKNGKSFQEFRDILKGGNGKRTVSGFSADESALVVLTNALMDDFIDWEKGACYFDGKEFHHLLDFISKDYKRYEYVPSGNGFVRDILDNKVTILFGNIFCVGDYLTQRQLYGEDLVFLGMPTDSGSGTALFAVGARIAVSSKTKNKAAAWNFLKYYCEKDMPNRSYFPIMTQKFESQLRLSQDVMTMSDESGNTVEKPLAFYFDGVQNHMIYKATKKECDDLVSLVQSADRKFEYHPEIMKIIQEEVGSLMSGDKSIEDVSEVIQNRVELYLKE